MRTAWDYSLETESLYLLHCAHQIATGFFRINGFLVLPYPAPATNSTVSFPDLPYLSLPRFWDRAGRINIHTFPISAPADLVNRTQQLLKSAHLPSPNYKSTKQLWDQHQNRLLKAIYRLMPDKNNFVSQINIWPTVFGTTCSFNLLKSRPGEIFIWLREDQGIIAIIEAILTSLTRWDIYSHLNGLWSESETIVDWLLTYSPLNSLLKQIDSRTCDFLTIKSTRGKQNATLFQVSSAFLKRIGAPAVSSDSLKNLPAQDLSPHERQVLDLLLSKSPNPATMNEIGDLLFKDNLDAYSLAAIAKTIQRLRDKLETHGISGSFIQTKRGEGYLLVNS